jgi:hypothetical protein
MTSITGNTYPVKDKLKSLGGKWDAITKAWMVPDDKAEEARKLVADAPTKSTGGAGSFRLSRCRDCGCSASRYNPIYRNGQCKSCWVGDKEERDMGY